MIYEYRNPETGEVLEHFHPSEPPAPGFVRIYTFGIAVPNGKGSDGVFSEGSSPPRTSVSTGGKRVSRKKTVMEGKIDA